jgi:hypothetical protein
MSEEFKLCKNCKYMKRGAWYSTEFASCTHPKNLKAARKDGDYYVTGKIKKSKLRLSFCSSIRDNKTYLGSEMCGPEGIWFEPKEKGFISRIISKLLCLSS